MKTKSNLHSTARLHCVKLTLQKCQIFAQDRFPCGILRQNMSKFPFMPTAFEKPNKNTKKRFPRGPGDSQFFLQD